MNIKVAAFTVSEKSSNTNAPSRKTSEKTKKKKITVNWKDT